VNCRNVGKKGPWTSTNRLAGQRKSHHRGRAENEIIVKKPTGSAKSCKLGESSVAGHQDKKKSSTKARRTGTTQSALILDTKRIWKEEGDNQSR